MPNNVINEIIFRNVSKEVQARILEKVVNKDGFIDFGILLPVPLNVWRGDCGQEHDKAFKHTWYTWNTENWGTKWNAYGQSQEEKYKPVVQDGDSLIFTFQTAWGPPYGWLCALYNFFGLSFEHNWFDEGYSTGHSDKFIVENKNTFGRDEWQQGEADDSMNQHLYFLLFGCEPSNEEEE